MVYDLTMLKTFYAAYSEKIERVRNVLQRPMTLAEKILYAHLYAHFIPIIQMSIQNFLR